MKTSKTNILKRTMKTVVMALALMLGAQLANSQNLNLNLVACYPLDCDNAVNAAATGSSYDAVSLPGVNCANGHNNVASTAYYFDGNPTTYIQLPGLASLGGSRLQPTTAISIAGWINTDDVTRNQHIVFTWNGCANYHEGYALTIDDIGGGNHRLRVIKSDGCSSTNQTYLDGSTNLSSGTWYHVGCVVTNDSLKLYLNGQLESSLSFSKNFLYAPSNTDVYLGGTTLAFNNPFIGYMDNFRFYDRKLKGIEFLALYNLDPDCRNCGLSVMQSSLIACYPFNCDTVNYAPATSSGTPSLNGIRHGTVNCATGHTGASNTCYSFNGSTSSYIELPNDSRLKPSAITVACYVKIDNINSFQYIVFAHNGCLSYHEGYTDRKSVV